MQHTHVYEVRPHKDHRGADLISDVLPFGRLLYGGPNAIENVVGYAKFYSRSCWSEMRKGGPRAFECFDYVRGRLL